MTPLAYVSPSLYRPENYLYKIMDSMPPSPRVANATIDESADDSFLANGLQALSTTSAGSGLHNTISPFNSFPAEIFLDILFRTIEFDHPYRTSLSQLHALALVCVYWWRSIRSDSRFWRDISLDEENMVQTVLKKNPNGPLFVKCRQTRYSTSDCTGFLRVAKQHAHRWQSAKFKFETGRQMEELHGVYAPRLKTIQIENETQGNDEDAFLPISLPQLKHLDLSNTLMTWGELSELKYLRLANIPETRLSINQLATLVSSSPGLEWLGLENVIVTKEDPDRDANTAPPWMLPALRGFEYLTELDDDEAQPYINRHLDAPRCYQLVTHITFQDLSRSSTSLKKLVKLPMEAARLRIVMYYVAELRSMSIDSAGEDGGRIASWASDPTSTPEISLHLSDVSSGQAKWSIVINTLKIPVERFGVTQRFCLDNPYGFSMDDIAFWDLTTRIEFAAGYPHIISILQSLSESNIKDGVSVWPCPRLESILLEYGSGRHDEDPKAQGNTFLLLQNAIQNLIMERSTGFDAGNGVNRDGKGTVPVEVTITADPAYIEKLRGQVKEGIHLVAS